MDIETLKDKLDGETLAKLKAHIDDLTGQRDTARAESIDGRKKLKAEVEQLRGIKDTLFQKLGLSDDADLDALPDGKGQAEAAKQFEARIKKMERDLAAANAARDEAVGKHKSAMQKALLAEAINGHEFVAREAVEAYVSGRMAWEGDELLFKTDEGKLVSVKDGITGLAKSKPDWIKPTGSGGAGFKSSNAGSVNGQKTMTRAEFEALSPQARVEAAKTGVTLS